MVERATEARVEPLVIKDCTITALATGEEAWDLREFRDRLGRIPAGSLYYHLWGRFLRPVFEEREYANDFADWAGRSLRDRALAERLALVDPADFPDLEALRAEMLEIVEERLSQDGRLTWIHADRPLHFIEGQTVVFDTRRRIHHPRELPDLCSTLSRSSLYYHVLDARHRSEEGVDDFQRWLRGFGESFRPLRRRLAQVDVSLVTLRELRRKLTELFASVPAEEAE